MRIEEITELSDKAKNSLLEAGYKTIEDLANEDIFDVMSLKYFKTNVKNMETLKNIVNTNGFPKWGQTEIVVHNYCGSGKTKCINSQEELDAHLQNNNSK